MWAIDHFCKTCSYSSQGSSIYSASLSSHGLRSGYDKKIRAYTFLGRIGDPLRAGRGTGAQGAVCNSTSSAGALAEATSVHPSESLVGLREAGSDVRHPVDLHVSLVDLAVEEQEQACDTLLVAPHTFQRVAQWQGSVAQPLQPPPQSQQFESCNLHSPWQSGGGQPAADSTLVAVAGGGWRTARPDSAVAGRGVEAWQGSAASGAATSAVTPATTRPLPPAVARSGFLAWELSSSSSWAMVQGATADKGNFVASADSTAATQHHGGLQLAPQAPTQAQEAWSAELAGRRPGSGRRGDRELGTQRELGPAAAGATKQAAATASEPLADTVGSGAWPLRADPWDVPALPHHRLASLLLDCAAKKVPVRLSALQSYADQVSYRAYELTADELVSALDGLSRYGFRTAPPPPLPPLRAAAASPRGSASARGLPRGSASPSAARRPSPTCWADRILSALLTEAPATGAAASAPPAVTAAAAAQGARDRSGATRGGGGHCRSGTRDAGGGPSRSRVAALEPRRVVDLAVLLTQLGIRPPRGWVNSFLSSTSHLLPHMAGGDLARLLRLLPVLQAAPDAAWWDVVLDIWAPWGPSPRQPPPPPLPPPELTSAGSGGAAAVVSTDDCGCEHSVGGGRMAPAANAATAAGARDAAAAASPSRGARVSEWGRGDDGADGACGADGRPVGSGSDGHSGTGGEEGAGQWEPSAVEVRSAVLYCISAVGRPQGTDAAAVISRLGGWARAALYDIAREALATGQLTCAGGSNGFGGSRSVTSQSSLPLRDVMNPDAAVSHDWGGGTATAARGSGGVACGGSLPPPPSARAIAQAMTALPTVMPGASSWAADPAGCGRGVLAVLVASLEPRLGEVPVGLLVELLRGFSRSALHPGPRFLLVHAVVLKGRTAELSPRQLLQAARYYTKLGLVPRGGLRVAVLRAREALRREALKPAARQTAAGRSQVTPGAIAVRRRQGQRHQL